MSEQPTPPENVRLILDDGTEFGCEVYFHGRDRAGNAQWMVTSVVPEGVRQVRVGVLPPRSAIVLPLDD